MTGIKQPEDKVWVAIHKDMALIRVEGRGSFKVSTSLKQFGNAAVDAGCHRVILDMSPCIGMDSTFMGVLAGLASRIKQQRGGDVVMLNLASRTRGLVATLGLDQIIPSYQVDATPEEFQPIMAMTHEMSVLQAKNNSKVATAKTMLEAHENLVKLTPENVPRFKDVLAFLREDLKRKTEAGLD
ncbi:MAG: STAS domain-containing protein [bacterium]